MSTAKWLTIHTVNIEISRLTPSQTHLSDTWKPGDSHSGDPFPHAVYYEGKYFLSDGHNRVNHCKKNGAQFIEVRLLYKVDNQLLIPLQQTG